MPPSERLVDDLADAILDGTSIDWAAAESSSEGTARPLVRQLRVLAAVAAFARGDHGRPPRASTKRPVVGPSQTVQTPSCSGVICGSSRRSAGARSEMSTGPGIRGLIAKSR